MEIDITQTTTYNNKTYKYLAPVLKYFGKGFTIQKAKVHILAIGLSDDMMPDLNGHYLFILLNRMYQPRQVDTFLRWVHLNFPENYVRSYDYQNNPSTKATMLVLKIPQQFTKAYNNLLQGKYSYMYNEDEISNLFPKGSHIRKVLIKHPSALHPFREKVRRYFDVENFSVPTSKIEEFELPLIREEETFNYTRKSSDKLFIYGDSNRSSR